MFNVFFEDKDIKLRGISPENIAIPCISYLKNSRVKDLTTHDVFFRKMDYNKIEKLHEDQFNGLVNLFDL